MKEEVEKQFEDTEQVVRKILQIDEDTRNDDLWLILQYWEKKDHIKINIDKEKLHEMTPPETITRVRRKIQNSDGDLLPTLPQVLIKRGVKEEIIRKYYALKPKLIRWYEELRYGIE